MAEWRQQQQHHDHHCRSASPPLSDKCNRPHLVTKLCSLSSVSTICVDSQTSIDRERRRVDQLICGWNLTKWNCEGSSTFAHQFDAIHCVFLATLFPMTVVVMNKWTKTDKQMSFVAWILSCHLKCRQKIKSPKITKLKLIDQVIN